MATARLFECRFVVVVVVVSLLLFNGLECLKHSAQDCQDPYQMNVALIFDARFGSNSFNYFYFQLMIEAYNNWKVNEVEMQLEFLEINCTTEIYPRWQMPISNDQLMTGHGPKVQRSCDDQSLLNCPQLEMEIQQNWGRTAAQVLTVYFVELALEEQNDKFLNFIDASGCTLVVAVDKFSLQENYTLKWASNGKAWRGDASAAAQLILDKLVRIVCACYHSVTVVKNCHYEGRRCAKSVAVGPITKQRRSCTNNGLLFCPENQCDRTATTRTSTIPSRTSITTSRKPGFDLSQLPVDPMTAVGGAVAALSLVALLIVCCWCKCTKNKAKKADSDREAKGKTPWTVIMPPSLTRQSLTQVLKTDQQIEVNKKPASSSQIQNTSKKEGPLETPRKSVDVLVKSTKSPNASIKAKVSGTQTRKSKSTGPDSKSATQQLQKKAAFSHSFMPLKAMK